MLGRVIEVIIDRPLGSAHPNDPTCIYPLNYGYVPGIFAGDGEEQDVYILGVTVPVERFKGRVIAIIHRINDNEDKWVVAPEGRFFSEPEIRRATDFVERYFDSELQLWNGSNGHGNRQLYE